MGRPVSPAYVLPPRSSSAPAHAQRAPRSRQAVRPATNTAHFANSQTKTNVAGVDSILRPYLPHSRELAKFHISMSYDHIHKALVLASKAFVGRGDAMEKAQRELDIVCSRLCLLCAGEKVPEVSVELPAQLAWCRITICNEINGSDPQTLSAVQHAVLTLCVATHRVVMAMRDVDGFLSETLPSVISALIIESLALGSAVMLPKINSSQVVKSQLRLMTDLLNTELRCTRESMRRQQWIVVREDFLSNMFAYRLYQLLPQKYHASLSCVSISWYAARHSCPWPSSQTGSREPASEDGLKTHGLIGQEADDDESNGSEDNDVGPVRTDIRIPLWQWTKDCKGEDAPPGMAPSSEDVEQSEEASSRTKLAPKLRSTTEAKTANATAPSGRSAPKARSAQTVTKTKMDPFQDFMRSGHHPGSAGQAADDRSIRHQREAFLSSDDRLFAAYHDQLRLASTNERKIHKLRDPTELFDNSFCFNSRNFAAYCHSKGLNPEKIGDATDMAKGQAIKTLEAVKDINQLFKKKVAQSGPLQRTMEKHESTRSNARPKK